MEVHLVLSRSGERTAFLEMGKAAADFKALAHVTYPVEDISCRLASGSFQTNGMVIAPCSIHTMSAIAAGIIEKQPAEPLAHMIMGSMNEAARLIAHASDKKRARREVSESANRMWNGLRIDTKRS